MDGRTIAGAAAAALAVYAIDQATQPKARPSSDIPPEKAAGFGAGLKYLAEHMPCGVARPGGPQADFLREFFHQRTLLTVQFGDLGIAGLTARPNISARCAESWIAAWLDAWQAARAERAGAWRIAKYPITGGALAGSAVAQKDPTDWRDPYSELVGPAAAGEFTSSTALSDLGKAWKRLIELHNRAQWGGDARPWLGAREVCEALQQFARELDDVGFTHGDAEAEAFDQLTKDLHPVRFVEKAADFALAPVEAVLGGLVGPGLALLLSTVVGAVLPYVVVGGAIYLVIRKQRAA